MSQTVQIDVVECYVLCSRIFGQVELIDVDPGELKGFLVLEGQKSYFFLAVLAHSVELNKANQLRVLHVEDHLASLSVG